MPCPALENPSQRPRPRMACCRQGPGIARCLSPHPPRLTALVTQQSIKEQSGRNRHALLRKQPAHPGLHIPHRRCPKLQRRLDRCTHHHSLLPWRPIDSEFDQICNCHARAKSHRIESQGFSWRRKSDSPGVRTRRPACMARSLSEDLRARVIAAVDGGPSRPAAAARFGVAAANAVRSVRD
jgi:hypothetical protein